MDLITGVRIPTGVVIYNLGVHTSFSAHPVSYLVCTGGLLPSVGGEAEHAPYSVDIKTTWRYTSILHMSSWNAVYLSIR
jgi:hypothetical protein